MKIPHVPHNSHMMEESSDDPSSISSTTELTPPDHFLFALTHSILKSYYREVTVVASTVSVILVLMCGIGACIIIRLCTSRKKNISEDKLSDLVDDSSIGSTSIESPFEKRSEDRHSGRKMMSWRSKEKKLILHKNIITPDRNITFVVPTIPLQGQLGTSRDVKQVDGDEQPSCSQSLSKAPMLAQQYYPQLSNAGDTSPRIGFCLFYELGSQILYVRLLAGQYFPEDKHHYATVKIYPGRGAKQRTKEYQGDSPIFNQEFSFHVRKGVLNTKVLKLRVAEVAGQHVSTKVMLGCVNLALKDVPGFENEDFTEDLRTGQLWKRLDQPSDNVEGVKLQVTLNWSTEPTPGLLTLKVIEASGLHENNDNDYTSSYVKVTLQEQGRNIKTRKTRLIRWGSVPYFDDVFVVTIPRELLSQISFLLVVIARGRLGSKVVLGKISIGPVPFANPSAGAATSGTDFWEDMCHQPNAEIVRWLQLLP